MKEAPRIDRRTEDRLKDEAHKIYLSGPKDISQCWFEAVWNEIQRMGYEIKKEEVFEADLET